MVFLRSEISCPDVNRVVTRGNVLNNEIAWFVSYRVIRVAHYSHINLHPGLFVAMTGIMISGRVNTWITDAEPGTCVTFHSRLTLGMK